jgi:hypothetical protein
VVTQVGIAGSTVQEAFVQVGGQAAMAGHLQIGKGARIGVQVGVMSDVPPGAALVGSPAKAGLLQTDRRPEAFAPLSNGLSREGVAPICVLPVLLRYEHDGGAVR